MSAPVSILDLLISLGVKERPAWKMVGPVREWFNSMSPELARVLLPDLVAALGVPGSQKETGE